MAIIALDRQYSDVYEAHVPLHKIIATISPISRLLSAGNLISLAISDKVPLHSSKTRLMISWSIPLGLPTAHFYNGQQFGAGVWYVKESFRFAELDCPP
jgi:hypothetical protein